MKLDTDLRELHGPNGTVTLGVKECDLLDLLLRHRGTFVHPDRVTAVLWPGGAQSATKIIGSVIYRLRRLIGAVGGEQIENDRGLGWGIGIVQSPPTLLDRLQPQARRMFDVLQARQGKLVIYDDLMVAMWGADTSTWPADEHAVRVRLGQIRTWLALTGDSRVIRTIQKSGVVLQEREPADAA